MKRRWFGVALALWAVVAPLFLIVSAPAAHADGEQFTFDTNYVNGQTYIFIRGINGGFKSGAELRAQPTPPNSYSSSPALGGLDGGCGTILLLNVKASGTAGVFDANLENHGNICTIAQGAIKIFDPNNVMGTGSAPPGTSTGGGAGGTGADKDPPPECDAGPASFLVCDWLIKPALSVIDWVQKNIIIPFLQEKPLDRTDDDVKPVYAIWSAFRNVASIFFILVFFLVIFGTAIGWDNYTVKKILPRLIAGAILVPFSWYICVIVIDIGNILGQGLVSLVSTIIPAPKIDFNTPLSALFLGGALLGVGAAAATFAATTLSLGVIFGILIAIIATLLTLVLRKVFILLLVVLSPFALLAWILPNTTKWFKEWWSNFFKLVMMYPIIMLIFEAGRLFASTAGATFGNGIETGIAPLFALVGLFGPTFMIPWAFRFAGKGLQAGAGAVGKLAGGVDKRVGKDSSGSKERHERHQGKMAAMATNSSSRLGRAVGRRASGTGGFIIGGGLASRVPVLNKIPGVKQTTGSKEHMYAKGDKYIAAERNLEGREEVESELRSAGRNLSTAEKIKRGSESSRSRYVAEQAELEGQYASTEALGRQTAVEMLDTRVDLDVQKRLDSRVAEASRETITASDGTQIRIADAKGEGDILQNIAKQAAKDENYPRMMAAMKTLGTWGGGTQKIREMREDAEIFGGTREEKVDRSKMGGNALTYFEQATKDIADGKADDLKMPKKTAMDGVSDRALSGMNWATIGEYVKDGVKLGDPAHVAEVGATIKQALSNNRLTFDSNQLAEMQKRVHENVNIYGPELDRFVTDHYNSVSGKSSIKRADIPLPNAPIGPAPPPTASPGVDERE